MIAVKAVNGVSSCLGAPAGGNDAVLALFEKRSVGMDVIKVFVAPKMRLASLTISLGDRRNSSGNGYEKVFLVGIGCVGSVSDREFWWELAKGLCRPIGQQWAERRN